MILLNLIIIPLVVALTVAFASTPLVIKLANNFGLLDDPKKNVHPKKIHKRPLPRSGGLSILAGVVVAIVFFLPMDKHIAGILAGCILVVAVGLLDDMYDLSPWLRLLLNFVAASIPIAAGIGIAYLSNPMGGVIDISHPRFEFFFLGELRSLWILPDILAIVWIMVLMNFLNMGAKGLPGQLSGVVVMASIVIALLSFSFSADIAEWPVTILASITAGAYLGFLPWHFFPQRIMPGYSGSTLAGFLLGVMTILTTTKVGVLLIVLAIPLIDTSFVILNRIRHGKSPVRGDTTHLHHRLLRFGLSEKQVVYFYWLVSAFLGLLALSLNTLTKITVFVVVAVALAGLIITIDLYLKPKDVDANN